MLAAESPNRRTVAERAGARTNEWDAADGPTPLTPTLHAAAADAPAARLANTAARIGDRCMGGAERGTTTSREGSLPGAAGTAWTARPNSASSSRLGRAGVAEVRRELSSRRSASDASRQRGQMATCWSQARSIAAGRVRSAYALSIVSTCRVVTKGRTRTTKLIGSPELPAPAQRPDGRASATPFWTDREHDARGPRAAGSDHGEYVSGPCRA